MKTFSRMALTALCLLAVLAVVNQAMVEAKPTLHNPMNDYGGTSGFHPSHGLSNHLGIGRLGGRLGGLGGLGGLPGYAPHLGLGPGYGLGPGVPLGYPGAGMMPGSYLPGPYPSPYPLGYGPMGW